MFSAQEFTLKKIEEARHLHPSEEAILQSESTKLEITALNSEGAHLKISNNGGEDEDIIIDYKFYDSYYWYFGQNSGAYIFRPLHKNRRPK